MVESEQDEWRQEGNVGRERLDGEEEGAEKN